MAFEIGALLIGLGMLAGPSGADLVSGVVQQIFPWISHITLALVGFLLGGKLTFKTLVKNGRQLVWISVSAALGALDGPFHRVVVTTGALVIDSNAFPALANPDGCQANRGIISRKITFERPFNSTPSVLPVFTQLDFNHDVDSRLRIEVRDINPTGFTVDFATWCDTRISQAKASWIAVGV